jgi:hypothetical protein
MQTIEVLDLGDQLGNVCQAIPKLEGIALRSDDQHSWAAPAT